MVAELDRVVEGLPPDRVSGTRPPVAKRLLGSVAPMIALWAAVGLGLSQITGRVTDWYVMTDELVYERLAIGIARSGSPLPRIHGVFVRSLDQLYPLLIAPFFRHGYVPADLHQAHLAGAWIMSSACIPAFLLARRVIGRRWAAYAIALLSIALPWLIYSSFLLSEVAAYPAFLWAMLAMQRAATAPSRRTDAVALAALVLAFLARTEFLCLVAVFPLALLVHGATQGQAGWASARVTARAHRLLLAVYAALVGAGLVFVAGGGKVGTLSVYGQQIHGGLLSNLSPSAFLGHLAQLAFGIGILPFVVGLAWLLANMVRPSENPELHAFACLGAITIGVLTLEVAKFDRGIGSVIFDRYLFYLVPVVLIAFVCALLDRRGPRWSLLAPVLLVSVGFIVELQASFTWTDFYGRLNPDSPISIFYKPFVEVTHSLAATRVVLAGATVVLTGLFALANVRVANRPRLAAIFVGLLAVFLPLETGWIYVRLFGTNGLSGRPLTAPVGGLNWLDRTIGGNASATVIPYHISGNYFISLGYWRDLEFWNKSVQRHAAYPDTDRYAFTGTWFPKLTLSFDPATGVADRSPTPYVVQAVDESRFRIAGHVGAQTTEAMLIDATHPWRLAWMTIGLDDDGWLQPHVPAQIRMFASPGQHSAGIQLLSLQVWAPQNVAHRPFSVVSNLARYSGVATNAGTTFVDNFRVCVPVNGFTDVTVTARGASLIPGDLSTIGATSVARAGSIYLADISVSDNLAGPCLPRSPAGR